MRFHASSPFSAGRRAAAAAAAGGTALLLAAATAVPADAATDAGEAWAPLLLTSMACGEDTYEHSRKRPILSPRQA